MGCSTSLIAFSATSTVKQTIVVSNEVLSREDINRIKKTWKLISTDVVDLGVKVLLNLFQLNPGTKRYFLPENLDGDLLTNIRFKSHATRLIQTFQIVVDNIDSTDTDVKPVLLEIGRQHSGFAGFEKDFWDSCHDAILQTWRDVLGKKLTRLSCLAWSALLDFMVCTMKNGYDMEISDMMQGLHKQNKFHAK